MKVLALVEGQSEESFVKRTLGPYLLERNIFIQPKLATTKKVISGPNHKGGIPRYSEVKKQILNLLGDTSAGVVTTMFDYYGLREDFPGMETRRSLARPIERVRHLEERWRQDVGSPRFVPYLALHEFEAFLFADVKTALQHLPVKTDHLYLLSHRASKATPEDINDSPESAPSKLLIHACRGAFQKTTSGVAAVSAIGIPKIRGECRHFDEWLRRLEEA